METKLSFVDPISRDGVKRFLSEKSNEVSLKMYFSVLSHKIIQLWWHQLLNSISPLDLEASDPTIGVWATWFRLESRALGRDPLNKGKCAEIVEIILKNVRVSAEDANIADPLRAVIATCDLFQEV